MKKILYLVALFLGLPFFSFAQRENLNWIIRDNCHIQFKADSSIKIHKMKFTSTFDQYWSHECHAAFSDTTGNLLFYLHAQSWTQRKPSNEWVNRSVLKDHNQDTLPNGDNIFSYASFTNGATFIEHEAKVYLFHLNHDYYRPEKDGPPPVSDTMRRMELRYTVLEKPNDKWVVTKKNILVSGDKRLVEKLALVRHANGIDWWIITHDFLDDVFHLFLFQNGEITYSISQKAGIAFKKKYKGVASPYTGEISITPNGNMFAMANNGYDLNPNNYDTELFSFDRCTGDIKLHQSIRNKKNYGAAFSPNGRYLYVCELYGDTYQYEVYPDGDDIEITGIKVSPKKGGGQLELGPDGKIYCMSQSSKYLAAIEQPNERGLDCGFNYKALYMDSLLLGGIGLPTFPNYRLGKMIPLEYLHTTAVCPNKIALIGIPKRLTDHPEMYAYQWSPSKGISDSTLEITSIIIDKPTTYVRRCYSKLFGCDIRYDTFVVTLKDPKDSTCLVSRDNILSEKGFVLYPNPTKGIFTLKAKIEKTLEAKIVNSIGKEIMKAKIESEHTFDLSKYPEGIYFIHIEGMLYEKIVVQR